MNTRQFSSKQEHRIAKEFNGKVVANSGATKFNKGDVVIPTLMLIECKTSATEKTSFSIKKEWLTKNRKEAFAMGLPYSMLSFDFGDGNDFFVIDKELAKFLAEKLMEENNND